MASATTALPRCTVRFAAMSFGIKDVAPCLPVFRAANAEVSIHLHLSDALADLVAEGFDLGLRIAALTDSSLRARRICSVGRSLVATPAYLATHGHPKYPDDLTRHACLGYA